MVTVIIYGLVLGFILLVIPPTRNVGIKVLALVGVLFVGTSIVLILGDIFLPLIPVFVIVAGIYGIYRLATGRKDKHEQKASVKMPEEERTAREEAIKDLL